MRAALLAALALLTATLAAAPGCGECSFEATITGVVTDTEGQPLQGATIETCYGDRCVMGPGDEPCASTTTDAAGRFTLDVPMCRPRPGECALRPIVVRKEGCEPLTVQPDRGAEVQLELECSP